MRGVAYKGKSAEFERFIDLPRRAALPVRGDANGRGRVAPGPVAQPIVEPVPELVQPGARAHLEHP